MQTYREVEFVCANSDFAGFKDQLEKHNRLYDILKQNEGIIAYRQDFSDGDTKQYSFAVILLDDERLSFVRKQADKIGLEIDLISEVPERFVDRVIRKELENQMVDVGGFGVSKNKLPAKKMRYI